MSKITEALEKAARERLLQPSRKPQQTVSAEAVTVPLAPSHVGEVRKATHVRLDPHLVSGTAPRSAIAEQYQMLRANLQSLHLRQGPKVFVVTSAVHGEGKSITSINLALTLARQKHVNVALVDGDLRKGSIHKWLGLDARQCAKGLSTALQQEGNLDGALVRLQTPPLTVLPAGPYVEQPAELFTSTHMKRLLAALKTQFDVVLIDAPPVLPVADAGILASYADGVLLVVRAGKTQRNVLIEAQTRLAQMKANILGCVLTHAERYLPGYARYYHYYREDEGNGAAAPAVVRGPSVGEPSRAVGSGSGDAGAL